MGNIELGIASIITIFISTFVIDFTIQKLNISKFIFVITEKSEQIADLLINSSPHGVTLLKGKGAYSNQEKGILICAMKDMEVDNFRQKVKSIDEQAFLIITNSERIFGKGFYVHQ